MPSQLMARFIDAKAIHAVKNRDRAQIDRRGNFRREFIAQIFEDG
jgi:hypothetical protein